MSGKKEEGSQSAANDYPFKKNDLATGKTREGRIIDACSDCEGTGNHPSGRKDQYGQPLNCHLCNGAGDIYEWRDVTGDDGSED